MTKEIVDKAEQTLASARMWWGDAITKLKVGANASVWTAEWILCSCPEGINASDLVAAD
jgi:hypothetical protein